MTHTKVPLPVRVPELGPSLGKLVAESQDDQDTLRLGDLRLELVNRLFESAGDARRLAAAGERKAALVSLGREAWMAAWDEMIFKLVSRIDEYVDSEVDRHGEAVRMPKRVRQQHRMNANEKKVLHARLGSAAVNLIPVLDELDMEVRALLAATATEKGALERWQSALQRAARRLEEAWTVLEDSATAELANAEHRIASVSAWRRSHVPVLVFLIGGLLGSGWFGAVLGGYIESPAWFSTLWRFLFEQ
ncbi:MAG: hypothetical protein ACE5FJ_01925 [Gemmatimonadales bacterium]